MKVLFVNSGKPLIGVGRFIPDQIDSLRKQGIEVSQYIVTKKGIFGYLLEALKLSSVIKRNEFDVIHSHYSFTGYLAYLSGAKRIVTSLLGSDVNSNKFERIILRFFINYLWDYTIVKSQNMKNRIGINKVIVIPNGVSLTKFLPINKAEAIEKTTLKKEYINILFFSNPPDRIEKNLTLAKEVVFLLPPIYKLNVISQIEHEKVVNYMNAGDILLMTSLSEGSPNIIKEALACNLPIISVNVGDVSERIDKVDNCFIVSYIAKEIADTIITKLDINKRTNGRDKLIRDGLDDVKIAIKLKSIYYKLIKEERKV